MKKIINKVKQDNERGARKTLIEELFYDFHQNRVQVYKMNFIRGLFFGFGSVIGGTLVIALFVWILSIFVDIFPPLDNLVNNLTDTLKQSEK